MSKVKNTRKRGFTNNYINLWSLDFSVDFSHTHLGSGKIKTTLSLVAASLASGVIT